MKKAECETVIRQLAARWAREVKGYDIATIATSHPNFYEFKQWAFNNGYGQYFDFRAVGGSADYHAELWFDKQLKQLHWR